MHATIDTRCRTSVSRRLALLSTVFPLLAGAGAAEASDAPDLSAVAGHWADERMVDGMGLENACLAQPLWVHPDGLLVAWDARYGEPELRAEIGCEADGSCTVLSDPDRSPPGLRIEAESGRIAFCAGSECPQTFVSCAGVDAPAGLIAVVSQKPVPPETPTALAPGLYVPVPIEAGFDPEWPDLLEACFADPVAVWPDGVSIGLMQVETDAGPAFEVVYAETCTPSDDPDWPLACIGEDAFVADADAASVTYRGRLVEDPDVGLLLETETEEDPTPRRFAMLQCTDDEGLGINLDYDPRGAVLLETIDGLRPAGAPPLRLGR
jgi:hypothetical protein